MTKKFLHTDKKANGADDRNEFIIPYPFELSSRLGFRGAKYVLANLNLFMVAYLHFNLVF